MKSGYILFRGEMVRALLAGLKTQTRRTNGLEYFSDPLNETARWKCVRVRDGVAYFAFDTSPTEREVRCRYGKPGDLIWVRETWGHDCFDDGQSRAWNRVVYRADQDAQPLDQLEAARWRPSIHMPRALSRITLRLTDVRVQRLQEISSDDAIAEGIEHNPKLDPIGSCKWRVYGKDDTGVNLPESSYESLWGLINGPLSWEHNPFVWALTFEIIRANVDSVLKGEVA